MCNRYVLRALQYTLFRYVALCLLVSISITVLGCGNRRASAASAASVSINIHVMGNMPTALQSAHTLARFLLSADLGYGVDIYTHLEYRDVIDSMRDIPNSFAIIDTPHLFYNVDGDVAPNNAPVVDTSNIRSLFALYQNFLHVLTNATALVDESNPRTGAPIAYYGAAHRTFISDIGAQIFNVRSDNMQELTMPVTTDLIRKLEQDLFGAIVFLDTYPSSLILSASTPYMHARLLPLSHNIIEDIVTDLPYVYNALLPIQLYPHVLNINAIPTLYTPTVLVTNTGTDMRIVQHICDVFKDNFQEYRTLYQQFELLTIDNVQRGLGIPLHAGVHDCIR